MSISSREFSLFGCRIDLPICIGNPIENEMFWKSWCFIFNRIPYINRQINSTSKKRKISTWNRHNFLTCEPFLIKLKNTSFANIDSESIAEVVLAGEARGKSNFEKWHFLTKKSLIHKYSKELPEVGHVTPFYSSTTSASRWCIQGGSPYG